MPNTLQEFLAAATHKASEDLTAAFLRLPEDKRAWSPGAEARTALDQMAECAILNGYTADFIVTRQWQGDRFARFPQEKAALAAGGWEALHIKLGETTARVIAAIQAVPDTGLAADIELPRGKMPLTEILARSYWNMTYHEGQIVYIASLAGGP